MKKRKIFEVFLDRMTLSQQKGMPFEAAWYAYAILEDRLVSMLRNSGGATNSLGKPIKMMGPKIDELRKRALSDALLSANLPQCEIDRDQTALWRWKCDRDVLMHGMASGDLTLIQIDSMVESVASEGAKLARDYAAAAARLKKHRAKMPL